MNAKYLTNFNATIVLAAALLLVPGVSHAEDWTYSVRPSDTLWELCKKFTKVPNCWQKIGPYNAVVFPRSLKPGTRIRFPVDWLKAAPKPAKVIFVTGKAFILTEGQAKTPALGGSTIKMGSRLIVEPEGTVNVVFGNGASMAIEGEAEVLFDQMSVNPSGTMVDTKINLIKGAIQTQVPKRKPAIQFEVHTPSAVAAVRGTNFRVSASNTLDPSTRNEVFEGNVEVSNAKNSTSVSKGFGILANPGQQLPNKVKLLPAPKIKTPEEFSKQANPAELSQQKDEQEQPSKDSLPLLEMQPQKISWTKIKLADHYKVQLFDYSNSALLWSKVTSKPSTTINDLKDGCYELRISGVDHQEFQGMPTKNHFCLKIKLQSPTGITATTDTIEWQPVELASTYIIHLSNDKSFSTSVSKETSDTRLTAEDLKHFKYFKIQAVDKNGVAGPFSKTISTPNSKRGLILFAVISLIFIGI